MRASEQWERAYEQQIATRQRPSILGGRDYYLGAILDYRPFGAPANALGLRRVRVDEIDPCGRNQCPVFSGRLLEEFDNGMSLGASVWGYDDQIVAVIHAGDIPAPFYIEVLDEHDEAWEALDEGPFHTAADAFQYARAEVGVEWRVVKKLADSVYVGIDEYSREVTDGEW